MPSGDLFSTKTNPSATKLASEMCGSIAMVIIRKNSSSGAKPQTLLAVFTGIFLPVAGPSPLRPPKRSRSPSGPPGQDDPLTVLPLDALHPTNARKHAVVGDLEEVAVVIFDFSRSRRTVRNCARDLRGGGSRCSGRSRYVLSVDKAASSAWGAAPRTRRQVPPNQRPFSDFSPSPNAVSARSDKASQAVC